MKINIINNVDSYIPQYIVHSSNRIIKEEVAKRSITYEFETNDRSDTMHVSDENIEEITEETGYIEGSLKKVFVNAYERNSRLRKACIEKYGAKCYACGFDFQEKYGDWGRGFIEVHHCIPLKNIRHGYIATVSDLKPVCSNCHSMLHKVVDKNMTIDELGELIKRVSTDH